MHKLKELLRQEWFLPAILAVLTALICLANWQPGTFLTGWDTLHPEVNFGLNFSRMWHGVWRFDQGLGAVAAHAHIADFPRVLLMWLIHFALPLSTLRYLSIFLPLLLGPLGIYFLLRQAIFPKITTISRLSAFCGGLFYLFNLGTVQHFYVVFEMFAYQYGFLPWLLLFAYKLLQWQHWRRDALIFFLLSFAAAPMAYASQLWFAYFAALLLFCGTIVILQLLGKRTTTRSQSASCDVRGFFEPAAQLKKATSPHPCRPRQTCFAFLLVIILTLSANAFWLLPNLYFLLSPASSTPAQAQINNIYSTEAFLFNTAFANLSDTLTFRSYLFDWSQYDFNVNAFRNLLYVWESHLDNPFAAAFPYLVIFLAAIGLIIAFQRRNFALLALLPVGLMAIFMIMNTSPLFNPLFSWLRDNIDLFQEGLRTPWTKFSLLLMVVMAILASVGLQLILTFLAQKARPLFFTLFPFIIIWALYFGIPMWQGQLISPLLRQTIPQEYWQLWQWSQNLPKNTRWALFPATAFNVWEYHHWGYQGPGFLWFGLPGSLLVRDFDRWEIRNEEFYRRLSHAFYSQDLTTVNSILHQYNVNYLIYDQSIFLPNDSDLARDQEIIRQLVTSQSYPRVFSTGDLTVYEVQAPPAEKELLTESLKVISADRYTNTNDLYLLAAPYYQDPTHSGGDKNAVIYPFADLLQDEISAISFANDHIAITRRLPQNNNITRLELPAGSNIDNFTLILSAQNHPQLEILITASSSAQTIDIPFAVDQIIAQIPTNDLATAINLQPDKNLYSCGDNKIPNLPQVNPDNSLLYLDNDKNSGTCVWYNENISNKRDYLFAVTSANLAGRPLKITVEDLGQHHLVLQRLLSSQSSATTSWFSLPSAPSRLQGNFLLNLENRAISTIAAHNLLSDITFYPTPLTYLSQIALSGSALQVNDLITFDQAYEAGWTAKLNGKALPHVEANGWQNAWIINDNQLLESNNLARIHIYYTPQRLETLGWLLFAAGLISTSFFLIKAGKLSHYQRPPV